MALSIPLPTQESDMLHLELVFINLQARDREEALSFLAQRMAALGVVSPDFPAAVLAREKAFPTGLQMPEAALALPHTETRFVLQPALAAAVLAEPVEFIAMGTEMQRLPVRLIFMPAVLHPDDQIQWLYRLMTVCQTPGFLPRLLQSPDRASFLGFLRAALNAVPRKSLSFDMIQASQEEVKHALKSNFSVLWNRRRNRRDNRDENSKNCL